MNCCSLDLLDWAWIQIWLSWKDPYWERPGGYQLSVRSRVYRFMSGLGSTICHQLLWEKKYSAPVWASASASEVRPMTPPSWGCGKVVSMEGTWHVPTTGHGTHSVMFLLHQLQCCAVKATKWRVQGSWIQVQLPHWSHGGSAHLLLSLSPPCPCGQVVRLNKEAIKLGHAREGSSIEAYQMPHKTCPSHQQVPH